MPLLHTIQGIKELCTYAKLLLLLLMPFNLDSHTQMSHSQAAAASLHAQVGSSHANSTCASTVAGMYIWPES